MEPKELSLQSLLVTMELRLQYILIIPYILSLALFETFYSSTGLVIFTACMQQVLVAYQPVFTRHIIRKPITAFQVLFLIEISLQSKL